MNSSVNLQRSRRTIFRVFAIGLLLTVTALRVVAREDAPTFVLNDATAAAFAANFDAAVNGDLESADRIFSPYFVAHMPAALDLDRDGWVTYVASFREGLPDLTQQIEEVIVADRRVIVRMTYHATHSGMFLDIAATGQSVTMTGIAIFRFDDDGLALESWMELDVMGLVQQLRNVAPNVPAG